MWCHFSVLHRFDGFLGLFYIFLLLLIVDSSNMAARRIVGSLAYGQGRDSPLISSMHPNSPSLLLLARQG